ncbi:MAG: hypothetical protein AAGB46_09560, partial [Verrucomicrobiota bacterium]
SGAKGFSGPNAKITVDREVIFNCSVLGGSEVLHPKDIGSALAEFMFLEPHEAIDSDNVIIASTALLDRRISDRQFQAIDRKKFDHAVWNSFLNLRQSLIDSEQSSSGNEPCASVS